ncbi:MAG: hypothetical protein ACLP50_19805 [Solirubrobacteraceae bacterium]
MIAADASLQDIESNILGQIHRRVQLTERPFAWHATLQPETFGPCPYTPARMNMSTCWTASCRWPPAIALFVTLQ